MKSYVAYNASLGRDVEIFRLDDNGNLSLTGDLTLGENGTLTAANLNVTKDSGVEIVRDPSTLEMPVALSGTALYYLGESVNAGDTYIKDGVEYTYSQSYIYGTWYEKYAYGYESSIDKEAIDPDRVLPGEFSIQNLDSFYILSTGDYSYIKTKLDSYPTTTNILVVATIEEGDANAHWEIKYYNSDTLLYTDVLTTNVLSSVGYNFPFTPLDADDYQPAEYGDFSLPIEISTIYAVKPVDVWDFNDYMPLSGGIFTGSVYTRNLEPTSVGSIEGVSPYSIGSASNRYNKGNN